MQRFILILLTVFVQSIIFGQTPRDEYVCKYVSFNISAGFINPRYEDGFYKNFSLVTPTPDAWKPNYFGFDMIAPLTFSNGGVTRDETYDANVGLAYANQPFIRNADSLSGNKTSFSFKFFNGKDLLFFSDHFDLPVRFGFNAGMTRFKMDDYTIRNPFFCVGFQVEPRIVIWRISLSLRSEIAWDISSKKWKKPILNWNTDYLLKNHYSCFQLVIGICVNDEL